MSSETDINCQPGWKPRAPTRGFSLVEVMLVTGIIALLAAIALPNIARARQSADDAKTQKELQSIYTAVVMFQAVNNHTPTSWDELRSYITIDESKYAFNPN